MKSETLSVLATIALFCILAVGGWALCSLANTVRDVIRRIIGGKKKKGRNDG